MGDITDPMKWEIQISDPSSEEVCLTRRYDSQVNGNSGRFTRSLSDNWRIRSRPEVQRYGEAERGGEWGSVLHQAEWGRG